MFGYVNIYKPELKVKEFYKYKAYYCGLCRTLRSKYGHLGQMTLTYDMTFLILLLTSLYESKITKEEKRCIVHPVKKQDIIRNEITEYAADMNIVLTYEHFLDDWQDEKSVAGLVGSKVIHKDYERLHKKYPRQCNEISRCLKELKILEEKQEKNIDAVSRCFGELMAELFVLKKDMWEESLRRFGFFLGKFIYIIDAYDDMEKDEKKGSYNPLLHLKNQESFEADCKTMLTMMMAECTREFEKLPCIIDIEILRNILYDGVWTKYDKIYKNRYENRKEQKA